MSVSIIADALNDVERYFEALPELATEAAFLAVNDSARDTVPAARRRIYSQVNFPKGYLTAERLGIKRKANRNVLEAVIAGRDRATSLARFAPGATRLERGQATRQIIVQVKHGKRVVLNGPRSTAKAFIVNLKNGNTGLAVRLPKGQTIQNSEKAVRLDNNVYLLYGPSVDQVFRGVSSDLAPDITEMVSQNFFRQFARLSARG